MVPTSAHRPLDLSMSPARPAVAEAIDALDPARFQALAEEYVSIQYPGRFCNLQRRGSNTRGETIAGWPDAYDILPDARLDVLEVTRAGSWKRHLQEDVEEATQFSGRLGGFVFVAWARTPEPAMRLEFQNKLVARGISSDRISFVFREQLVSDLCQPKFALLWEKYLGLSAHCLPFRSIEQARIYGSAGQANIFTPSREEYLQGLVHRPQVTSQVEDFLKARGWALVRGKGASGKTVLAVQVALSEFRTVPVYYLDLTDLVSANEADSSRALDVITWRKDQSVLFIVDNIHMDEQMTREIFDHWQSAPAGSRLLLLGRWTEVGPDPRGLAASLEGIDQESLKLEVKDADLLGVLHRLAARTGLTDKVGSPPAEAVRRWLALFGGDLIAFSAAAALRIARMAAGEWELTADDAKEYVRNTYLYQRDSALTDYELHNLLLIAALSKLELAVPDAAIKRGDLRRSLRAGLVHRTEQLGGRIVKFRLVHPGFGELLLSAADPPIEEKIIHREFALAVPGGTVILAAQLEKLGQRDAAVAIARLLEEKDYRLSEALLCGSNLNRTPFNCNLLQRLGVCSLQDTDEALCHDRGILGMAAVNTVLHSLKTFLRYSQLQLPGSFALVAAALAEPINASRLMKTALQRHVGDFASFLDYAHDQEDLKPAHKAISAAFSEPSNLANVMEAALRSPLEQLAFFLGYAELRLRKAYKAIAIALNEPGNLDKLIEAVLRSPIEHLASFLGYAELRLPKVHKSIAVVLLEPGNMAKLVKTALRSPLEHLVSFLAYSASSLPKVYTAIAAAVAEPANEAKLAETALQATLERLVSFLRFFLSKPQLQDIPAKILSAIDLPTWDRFRLASLSDQPSYMCAAAMLFQKLGRPELMVTPAQSAITRADASLWHSSTANIYDLEHVLRYGHAVDQEALEQFLRVVVTNSWLEEQYEFAHAGTIAGCLFAVWAYQKETVINHFFTGALGKRVAIEIKRLGRLKERDLAGAIGLLGCCSLMVRTLPEPPQWPSPEQLQEEFRFLEEQIDSNQMAYVWVPLWLGLREIARLMPEEIQISHELGEGLLLLWRKSDSNLERHLQLNRIMVPWLERCSSSDWRLLREPNSLYDELSREAAHGPAESNTAK
ncbi:MAG: hypothetical protein LAP21_00610 [Acidobacteriia bacterium]|nr:hypothetical protein [Terriglobia bacterium]